MGFREATIEGIRVIRLERHEDARGLLVETFRIDSLPEGLRPLMAYLSYTRPGVGRGPHEHSRQTDVFAFVGPANFRIYLWDNRPRSQSFGSRQVLTGGQDNPITLVVPPGVVHAYRNDSETEIGMVLNFPDQLYAGWGKQEAVDEIRHEDAGDAFFKDFLT